jgi:hypothetical protein
VRADPGRQALLARLADSTVEERVAWLAAMRDAGMRSAWQQVDRAGLVDPIEIADFLLRRIYPEESEAWFGKVVEALRSERAAGTWHGFTRPASRT